METFDLLLSSHGIETSEPLVAMGPDEAIAFAKRALLTRVIEQDPVVASCIAVFAGRGDEAEARGVWDFDPETGATTWTPEE